MFDLIVIGGGPAGVTAALRARELGAEVALVERGRMGGICTNDGCVPTRVLARAARLVRDSEQFDEYGLGGVKPSVDFARLLARTRAIIEQLHDKKRLLGHLEEAGVTVRDDAGPARFTDPHTLALQDGGELRGEKFVICAGGHARRLPFPGTELAWTHSDIWSLPRLPRRVVIVGGAATGCQLASILAALGAEVTLVDTAPRLLPGEDEAVSKAITNAFARHDIRVITGIKGVERIKRGDGEMRRVHLAWGDGTEILDAEGVVVAVGWPGNVEEMGLDAAGVRVERSYIVVDDRLQTSAPHIFAAGDVTGRMMLVQSAGDEARIAAENAVMGAERRDTHRIVPHGGFTDPEYGSVGLSEERARRERGEDCLATVVPYADLDRAVIDGRPEGFCKLVVSRETRQVLGAHVVGEQALEVVQIVAAAMAAGSPVELLANLELAYPTFTGIVGLAARQLCRELGVVQVSPQWRSAARHPRAGEWEHSATP